MSRFVMLMAGIVLASSGYAQTFRLPADVVKYGPCQGAWEVSSSAGTWEFNAAANGHESLRATVADLVRQRHVRDEDFEELMRRIHRPGRTLDQGGAEGVNQAAVHELALDVADKCLRRAGKELSRQALKQCVAAGAAATLSEGWRSSGISKDESMSRLIKAAAGELPDALIEEVVARVYGDLNFVKQLPEIQRTALAHWMSYAEFSLCVAKPH